MRLFFIFFHSRGKLPLIFNSTEVLDAMTTKKLGRQTVALANPPTLAGHANVVGKKEGEGPLASSFDLIWL